MFALSWQQGSACDCSKSQESLVPKSFCAALCSSVHPTSQPGPPLPGPRGPASTGQAGLLSPIQAGCVQRPGSHGGQASGLVAGGWCRRQPEAWRLGQVSSHPVPQHPALAVQLWGLLCRAPGPGISHVWLVTCQGTRWSALTVAFCHSHPICPLPHQLTTQLHAHPLPTPASPPTLLLTHLSTHWPTQHLHTPGHPMPPLPACLPTHHSPPRRTSVSAQSCCRPPTDLPECPPLHSHTLPTTTHPQP